MSSGIYEIVNTVNGKRYIGQSADIPRRWSEHRRCLRRGCSRHLPLQSSWNMHGEAAFAFNILVLCDPENLTPLEQQWFDSLKPEYNICPAAGSRLRVRASDETRAKMSVARLGKKQSPEHAEKKAAAIRGTKYGPQSREHVEKRLAAQRGRKQSPASIEKRADKLRGKKRTQEQRENIRNGTLAGNARKRLAV